MLWTRRLISSAVLLCLSATNSAAATVIDFEDFVLPPSSFHNGHPDGAGVAGIGTLAPGATFSGAHLSRAAALPYAGGVDGGPFPFFFWDGWSISSKTDAVTPGFGNQYSALAGGGSDGSANYAVGFFAFGAASPPSIQLPAGGVPRSIDITNTTYAGLSMRDGDAFAKKFGGSAGTDQDTLILKITGDNGAGSLDFFLADYRSANPAEDFIVDTWVTVDISSLARATQLQFSLATTDIGPFGPSTPMYFAVDNLVLALAVPEPASGVLFGLALCGFFGRLNRSFLLRRAARHGILKQV